MWLSRAELTWEAPGPAHSGTAERLGADEACQLVLAPLQAHSTKAGSCPVVCRADGCGQLASGCPHPIVFCISMPASPTQASASLAWTTAVATFSASLYQHTRFFPDHSLYSYCSPSLPDELLFTLQNPFSPKHSPTNLQERPGPPSLQTPGHVWRPPPLPQAHPPFKPGQGPMDAPLESLSHP